MLGWVNNVLFSARSGTKFAQPNTCLRSVMSQDSSDDKYAPKWVIFLVVIIAALVLFAVFI
jgi:hypothetical protein